MQGSETVKIIIPVFGDHEIWDALANRAFDSVCQQTYNTQMLSVAISEDDNITKCRNKPSLQTNADWLLFLDADDTLHPTYIEEMLKKAEQGGDIFVPSVHRHYEDGTIDTDQHWYTPKDLMTGNYIVVSAMIRTSLFKQIGGFHDYESLEDWDLWLRAEEVGARFVQCPEAILHISKRAGSRNSNVSYNQILENAKARRGQK